MARTTVTLPQDLLDELVDLVGARNKTQAVLEAVWQEIRRRKRQRIRNLAGRLEFDLTADDLRHGAERTGLR